MSSNASPSIESLERNKSNAISILLGLQNPDASILLPYLHPTFSAEHGGAAPSVGGAEGFVSLWQKAITLVPNFRVEVVNAVAEGNLVWVLSKATGLPGGREKESVDMMTFDDEGKCLRNKDIQREW